MIHFQPKGSPPHFFFSSDSGSTKDSRIDQLAEREHLNTTISRFYSVRFLLQPDVYETQADDINVKANYSRMPVNSLWSFTKWPWSVGLYDKKEARKKKGYVVVCSKNDKNISRKSRYSVSTRKYMEKMKIY